jgi:hypothetical protein
MGTPLLRYQDGVCHGLGLGSPRGVSVTYAYYDEPDEAPEITPEIRARLEQCGGIARFATSSPAPGRAPARGS